jgi:hypothetical protein
LIHITKRANPLASAEPFREKIPAAGIAFLTDFHASLWDFTQLALP